MKHFSRCLSVLALLCLSGICSIANATNYTLWINGRTGGGTIGDYTSFTYWGPASTAAGVNKKAVNWTATTALLRKMVTSAMRSIAFAQAIIGAMWQFTVPAI